MAEFCIKSLHSSTLPQLFRLLLSCNERSYIGVPRWSRTAALLGLYIAISTITRLVVSGNDIVNVDESSYMVGAWELLKGHLPYAGFADNKPPLIYVYYALTQLLGHGMWSVRAVTMLVTVPLTALAASAFYGHDRRGVAAALTYLVFSAAYDAGEMLAVNCELVMMLPLAWAIVLVRDESSLSQRRMLGVGVLIGIASLVKYQAVLWVPAIMAAIAVARSRSGLAALFRTAVVTAAGLLIPVAAAVTVFAAAGGIEGVLLLERYAQHRICDESDDSCRRGRRAAPPS